MPNNMTTKNKAAWRTVKLGDIAEIQTGPFGSQLHQEDYVFGGTPIVTVEHLGDNRISGTNIPGVSDDDVRRLDKFSLREGDVVFSRVGSVDRRALITKEQNGWLFSGRCLRVRPHPDMSGVYLSYYFGRQSFKSHMRNIAVGATMPSLNTTILSSVSVMVPPLNIQNKIASILSVFDEKIENNNRTIKILEEMAQVIFKEWFVHFRFPAYESSTFLKSPTGLIPKGWQEEELAFVLDLEYGKALKEEDRTNGDVVVVGSSGIVGTHNKRLIDGPGIVVGRKGVAGSIIWVDQDFYPIDTTFYVKTDLPLIFCLYLLKSLKFQPGDSAVPGLNREDAYRYKVLVPTKGLMEEFQKTVKPMFAQRYQLQNENQKLATMRDLLLPRLMSGEIRV